MKPYFGAFVLMACGLISGCFLFKSSHHLKDQKIKIAFVGSLTGDTASFSKNTLKGIELALKEAKKDGIQIELIVKNNGGNPETAVHNMNELVTDNNIMAILGEVSSGMSLTIAPIAQRAQIPMITPTSTNPRVTEVGDYIFRICFIDPFQGYVMAKFAREHLKVDKVAVLKDRKSDYSKGLASFFTKTFEDLSGHIVMDEVYNTGDRDFKIQLEQIRKTQPEAVFLPGYYRDVALIARQARIMGIQAYFLGGDGWDSDQLFEIGREAVNGSYFSNHFTVESNNENVQQFVKAYRETYHLNPDGLSARGYDATNILITAMKNTKELTRKSLRDELAKINNFPGATGNTSINSHRNAKKPAVVLKVEGPANRYITTIAPE
ncbi:MAG: ABC transporter substrate-binding protein [Bdellovibrionales bacterium]|nr:ABC transporter substrate-binding protein [Bdellovibrionales bacterium]